MNRRVWVCVGLIFGCALVTNRALGQQPPPMPGIPVNIKQSSNANEFVTQIRTFIIDQVTRLQSADIPAQSAARKALTDETKRGSTPSFYLVYAKEWNTAAVPLMSPGSPLRLRLNVAIITASVAESSDAVEFEPAVEPVVRLVLGDKEACIRLWGIKAGKALINLLLQAPPVVGTGGKSVPALTGSKLTAAIVSAVTAHDPLKERMNPDMAGLIASDTYSALAVSEIPGVPKERVKAIVPPLVTPILDVLEFRVTGYTGSALPTAMVPSPGAEREVTTFLSSNFSTSSTMDQKRIINDLVTLITYAGERSALYATSKSDMAQIREMLKYASQSMVVIVPDPGFTNAMQWLTGIPPSATPVDIVSHTKSVWPALNEVFKKDSPPRPAPLPPVEPKAPPAPAAPASPAPLPTP